MLVSKNSKVGIVLSLNPATASAALMESGAVTDGAAASVLVDVELVLPVGELALVVLYVDPVWFATTVGFGASIAPRDISKPIKNMAPPAPRIWILVNLCRISGSLLATGRGGRSG